MQLTLKTYITGRIRMTQITLNLKLVKQIIVTNHGHYISEHKYLMDCSVLKIHNECTKLPVTPNGRECKINIYGVKSDTILALIENA